VVVKDVQHSLSEQILFVAGAVQRVRHVVGVVEVDDAVVPWWHLPHNHVYDVR
jgi:hypothetical protein